MLVEQKLNQEQAAAAKAQAEQLEFQKQRMKLELEHQKQISPLKENVSASISGGMSAVRIAKMPKLVISKFEGTSQDWVRFSGQFSSQIESTSEPATTKFSYLKELVDVKVRKPIDGLPFIEEGYIKAKALLEKKYGQKKIWSHLANAVNSGYDRGERCLSPVFFAMLTCWHLQFSKIFAFPFFFINELLFLEFLDKIGLARKSRVHNTMTKRPRFPL